ncbi:hypothetical protein CNMCM6805_005328 [Aspergillus fumigatiaffinis]|uniref:Cytochrome P450 monooxygenase n=1 Tax=Aspergillus fumigatiaffinis TaxID=340414 RepID=A0A8H4GPK6_9EURO|nr:hypothetical protein CNMCM6805_005328 [Aspergillus fumigatiaffinis]
MMLLQQLTLMIVPISMTWQGITFLFIEVSALALIYSAFYNVYLHPLRKYPGPWWLAASRLPYSLFILRGTATTKTRELHDKYGHVVRISPDTLSYTCKQVWSDVYGGDKTGYKREIPKDPIYYMRQGPVSDISSASSADHSRLRRMLAPLFSQRAVTLQENYLRQHIALLIARLARPNQKQEGRRSGVVNLTHWLNLLTTDVMGELTFGETFGGLDNGKLHPWLEGVFWIFKISSFIREVNHWSTFARKALICCVPRRILEGQQAVISFCEDATARRMQQDPGRPDFMSHILEKTGGERMTKTEAELAAVTLIIAGSETVATMLSGTVYLLCTNPRVLRDLTERIRADFRQESDLNLVNLQHHQFLNSTILECLRLYPPAPDSLFRRTIASETIIMGKSVPPQTCVTMNLWAANRSAFNFHRPNEMVPERWAKPCPKEFQDDDRDVMRPFSVGQRDCLGKNLLEYKSGGLLPPSLLTEFAHIARQYVRDYGRKQQQHQHQQQQEESEPCELGSSNIGPTSVAEVSEELGQADSPSNNSDIELQHEATEAWEPSDYLQYPVTADTTVHGSLLEDLIAVLHCSPPAKIIQRVLPKPRLCVPDPGNCFCKLPVWKLWRPDMFAHRLIIAARRSTQYTRTTSWSPE